MNAEEIATIQCPYCWETFEVMLDCSVPQQQYTEDCQVCCQPIAIKVSIEDGQKPVVEAIREDD